MLEPDLARPVHVTQTAPVTISPGELSFYDVIDAKIVSRSGVLLCIAEAGGDAKLPEAVSTSEFRAWVAACAASNEDKKCIPLTMLSKIIPVRRGASLCNEHEAALRTGYNHLRYLSRTCTPRRASCQRPSAGAGGRCCR